MFNGARISKALIEDLDRNLNPEKYLKLERKKKLKKIQRKQKFNNLIKKIWN